MLEPFFALGIAISAFCAGAAIYRDHFTTRHKVITLASLCALVGFYLGFLATVL